VELSTSFHCFHKRHSPEKTFPGCGLFDCRRGKAPVYDDCLIKNCGTTPSEQFIQVQRKAMILTQELKGRSMVITSLLVAILAITSAVTASAGPPAQSIPAAVFATDTNAGANAEKVVPGAAAVVDGHVIPMEDVTVECLRKYRSYEIDQMVQKYVLDRECEKRGITVNESEIDKRIAELRTNLAPATLEDTLEEHHMTMSGARDAFREDIKRTMLVADQIKPVKMVHCREIVVKCASSGAADPGTSRTEATALAVVKDIQEQLKQGRDFNTLIARYSENEDKDKKGDMGVLYENILGLVEAPVLDAALALHKGELSPPVRATDGFHIIKADSTGDDHPQTEDSLYADAARTARHVQIQFLVPKTIVGFIDKSKMTFVDDADLVVGKPLPEAAAIIDGHAIPMKDVLAKCLADYGPKYTDILVQNYIVDRECERRKIKVSEAEIDSQIAALRKQIAPTTLDEGLKMHHTTMDGLKYDFQQQIERTKLVMDRVKPEKLVHVRAILVTAAEFSESASGMKRTDVEARALIMKIQDQLKAGKSFEEMAKQYSEIVGADESGDMGILYEGRQGMDTAILNTALAMEKGGISPDPVKTNNGYFLLQAISTSDTHASDEDAAYAEALATCREQKAQSLIPQAIVELIKKSKVVYYVHS
jgi:parvulin-like peptidyl-prolyl isomerase